MQKIIILTLCLIAANPAIARYRHRETARTVNCDNRVGLRNLPAAIVVISKIELPERDRLDYSIIPTAVKVWSKAPSIEQE